MIMRYSKRDRMITLGACLGFEGIVNALSLSEIQDGSKISPALADIHVRSVDVVNAQGALRQFSQPAAKGFTMTGDTKRGSDGLVWKNSATAS